MTEYIHPARDLPDTVRGDLLITTVRVEEGPGHDHVHVWNRGGKAGTLIVTKGDGHAIASRLLPRSAPWESRVNAHEYVTRSSGIVEVTSNVSGTRMTTMRLGVPDWCYCVRCGCSERAVEAFGWACEPEAKREEGGMSELRIWHNSRFGESAFYREVESVDEAVKLLTLLAEYDLYQGDRVVANAQGLERLVGPNEWEEWEDLDGYDICGEMRTVTEAERQ